MVPVSLFVMNAAWVLPSLQLFSRARLLCLVSAYSVKIVFLEDGRRGIKKSATDVVLVGCYD